MDKDKDSLFKLVDGLKPVDANDIAEYEHAMDEAIPEMLKDVEKRQALAADARHHRGFYGPITGFHDLNLACRLLADAFGHCIYLVGSSAERRDYRDVDVRAILPDEDFDAMFPGGAIVKHRINARLLALNLSISAYLSRQSGLPVDFQFQRMTEANAEHGDRLRNPMGIERWAKSAKGGTDGR